MRAAILRAHGEPLTTEAVTIAELAELDELVTAHPDASPYAEDAE